MRRRDDGAFEFRRPDGRVVPACGYSAEDAAADPVVLEERGYPSMEAWLAALIRGRDQAGRPGRGRSFSPRPRS